MVKLTLLSFCFLMVLAFTGFCFGVEGENSLDSGDTSGIYGLVVHQARSRLGNEFFQYFTSYWQAPQGIEGYNIYISDQVHPRFGTWVFITVNDVVIHRERMNTRLWEIDEAAKKSIHLVTRYVISNFGNQKLRFTEDDLAGDGF